MSEVRKVAVDAEVVDALSAGEPEWLAAARARAFALHRELPLPDRAVHRWRYVDPARLMPGPRAVQRRAGLETAADLADDGAASVLVRRGPGVATLARSGAARAAGVVAMDLARAAREHADLVRPWLGQLVQAVDNPFTALNAALWSGGLFLYIPPRAHVERPIHIVNEVAGDDLAAPRTLIVVGAGAEATILEEWTGGGAPLVHQVKEVIVGAGAQLHLVVVQELPREATAISTSGVRLESEAQLFDLFAGFGGAVAKADLLVDLEGRGAAAYVRGAVFGGARQQFDNHTVIQHRAPDAASNLDVRVALSGRAKASTTGRLFIGHEAVRSEAYQENRNLLLSENANAVSLPELEILTDEVQAKHGATVGPIDEDQLYYLSSRGLSRDEAAAMIVEGFFEGVLQRVPAGLAQDRVRTRVQARLAAPAGR